MSQAQKIAAAIQAHQRGDVQTAEKLYHLVLGLEPSNTTAMVNLAAIAIENRKHDVAEQYLRKALSITCDNAGAYSNLRVVLRAQGRLQEAISAYQQAIRLNPNYADAHHNLGNALREQGQLVEAAAAYKLAIQLKPNYPEAHNSLGNVLREQGLLKEAITAYRQSVQLRPHYPEAYSNLGVALRDQGCWEEAVAAFEHAIRLRPDYPQAFSNLGVVLRAQGKLEQTIAAYTRAIKLKPDYPEAYNNLGNALQDQGRVADAIEAYRHAIELRPDYPDAVSQLVHQRQHACDWTSFETDQKRLLEIVRQGSGGVAPFILLASSASPADQLLCSQKWAEAVKSKVSETARFRHTPSPRAGKVKLGYLSADFHQHATAYLMADLFEHHDRSKFEVLAYSYGRDDGSDMRKRLSRAFNRFVDIRALPHLEAARRIHEDGIDILIDLKGYTTHARTEILAYRPAPIQVNYLGYPGTMGGDFVDYIIVDGLIASMSEQQFYSERLVHLPDCYQPNDTKRQISEPTPSRSDCDLPEQGFVFCCFNNSYKINPTFFDIWMRLLKAAPDSVLWLLKSSELVEKNLQREAAARGIDRERLIFAPRRPLSEHLARHRQASLFLDTMPCSAHTTASDAVWAGLPVLTCMGQTFAGRVAGSLLRAAGMPELIASSTQEYEATALELVRKPKQLAGYRQKLAQNRLRMPLFDIDRFTKNIEAAFRSMWETWSAGRAPTS